MNEDDPAPEDLTDADQDGHRPEDSQEIPLPPPNLKDGDGSATYRNETSVARRTKEWGVKYEHPLDSYATAPKQRSLGIGGCIFLGMGLLLVCLTFFVFLLGWATTGRFVQKGYEVVRLSDRESVLTQSPDVPTCYLGRKIDVRIPKCSKPIAVIGTDVTLRGDFLTPVSFMAFRLHATKQARFARDLEIYAGEFHDESVTLLGDRSGFTLRETGPEKPEPNTP
ncbi:MAG: hypothetical protein P1U85_15975 [Verrucomicrobiales bacterium]|jgi:hypothetical protein|nr:hypothetical protein [Verrucomicrobiales bacterium]